MSTLFPRPFGPHVLSLDAEAECDRIATWLRTTIARQLHRRGAVIAVSGGVDSAVCAALARRALGPELVTALFMPATGSPPDSAVRARELCAGLGIPLEERSIVPTLEALGCHRSRDAAIARVFPDLPPGSRHKITIASGLLERARLPLDAYLQLTAATNMHQRVRKLLEYSVAEERNYAVLGTPNRLEYELGFFVRGGDGLADLEPIAHLFKTQVYALAEHLGVPAAIRAQPPSTETYSLPQTQQEFFFALPHDQLDLLLWAKLHGLPIAEVAAGLRLTSEQVERAWRDIDSKQRVAARLRQAPLLLEQLA
jgi:NAD+ synthase